MSTNIYEFRLSFIWTEPIIDLLSDPVPSNAPFAFLGRSYTYEPVFDKCQQDDVCAHGLQLPWPGPVGNHFWTYYFEGQRPGDVSGKQAWKALVPFRWCIPATAEVEGVAGRILNEAFFYPHGIAFVLTAICTMPLILEEVVEIAHKIRRRRHFQIQLPNQPQQKLNCESYADKCLRLLQNQAFGAIETVSIHKIRPFSVFTVIRTDKIAPDLARPTHEKIHRILEALTGWRPTWEDDVLPEFKQAALPIQTAPENHVLYGNQRGRAVWFPSLTEQTDPLIHSLGCYHRNLVFASMQVESLGGLIQTFSDKLEMGLIPTVTHRECARRAAGILGRFYAGDPSIYRSWSMRAQMEQNNLVEPINLVRDYFDMESLNIVVD